MPIATSPAAAGIIFFFSALAWAVAAADVGEAAGALLSRFDIYMAYHIITPYTIMIS
jgi:hypothetical protein